LSLDSELPVSTLYGDINSPLFAHFHEVLSRTARAGQTSYRFRYRPYLSEDRTPLVLSGYGVELALKRTDYIVIDDRSDGQAEKDSSVKESGSASVPLQIEELDDLKPLSSSELSGLGLKVSSFILNSESPLDTLVKVSQDFPKHSFSIAKLNASDDFISEHRLNRELRLPAGTNIIWINGIPVDARQVDAYALLDQLRSERNRIQSLKETGLSAFEAISLISHESIAESKAKSESIRYDFRDDNEGGNVIIWLNDIEKDKRYEDWPGQISAVSLLIANTFRC
jgi:UDP-glucose:glycoprotein glucosyltransferase